MGSRSRRLFATLFVALVAAGCVQNPAAPARTPDAYAAALDKTVGAATSSVSTTQLAATALARGDAFFPYTVATVSGAEDELGSVVATFSSIQPPDQASVDLRTRALDELSTSQNDVAAVRIVVQNGSTEGLDQLIAALHDDADHLAQLVPS
jgi:hypothetical protein